MKRIIIIIICTFLVSCIPMRGQAGDMRELSKGTAAKVSGGTITPEDAQRTLFPWKDGETYDFGQICYKGRRGIDIIFPCFESMNIPPFILHGWEQGQDCLDIEYKGRHYFVGDGCVKEVRP